MLQLTTHAQTRMNQRGITLEMIQLVLEYGKYSQDRVTLVSRDIQKVISKVSQETKIKLLKILDKGGITVVLSDAYSVITVFNKFKRH
jgi:hypothetical protein